MRNPRGGVETAWSHWSALMEGMQASPNEVYQAILEVRIVQTICRDRLSRSSLIRSSHRRFGTSQSRRNRPGRAPG